ncbi:DUF3139 domain-containing protein [Alkalicoccobacillus plakortidis]|uniref:DUF3139 domain-containing protein n=1 Tax=Alkalicoccobacillus plakortidis TaxID=444060 RepID=A0ABT0XH05_9BACI|nr:DUF3139 domain-containing protein [Alkalicoccobacillus plakortidis]MCM2675201.1 DUF3139 domain-containing protein [Alkalicoccobacillus plakortidis]
MKRTTVFISLFSSIVIIIGGVLIFRFFTGSQAMLDKTGDATYVHLIEDRQYQPGEIKNIRTVYSWKDTRENAYNAYVEFADEPGREYEYIYNDNQGIRQTGSLDGEGNHVE